MKKFPFLLSPYFLLPLMTAAVYWPVATCEFINYDDLDYVAQNGHLSVGMTWEAIRWAFTTDHAANWHPVTWLSHLLDVELFGLKAGWHHLTNLLFHLANTVLLFAVLKRLTGALWRSAMVAALFALHPLHVESVAWVSERKDVLSTAFFLLTLWAYCRYTERQKAECRVKNDERLSNSKFEIRNATLIWYGLALGCFALGLMSKPMLVTLPFVLLLLDGWPLRRIEFPTLNAQRSTLLRLLREKVPFFLLSAASCVVTYRVQKGGGAVSSWDALPFWDRAGNAVVSYVRYLGKTLWPVDLAILYPYPGRWPVWLIAGAVLLLLVVTIAAVAAGRRRPYLWVGWFWFLGALVPVIGLVQVGGQAMADRYTYMPLIGLFILVTWGMADLFQSPKSEVRSPKPDGLLHSSLYILPLAVLAGCVILTARQLRHWQNTITLFTHALKVTRNNYLAHANLAMALSSQGRVAEAIEQLEQALRLRPDYPGAHSNLAIALLQQGRMQEAVGHLEQALRLKLDFAEAHNNLGKALERQGKIPEAIEHYEQALRLKAGFVDARHNLGKLLVLQKRMEEAIALYMQGLAISPKDGEGHYYLASVLARQGRMAEAVHHLNSAVEIKPDHASAANDLAWILATDTNAAVRDVEKAVRLAERACELTASSVPIYLDTLGVAYSEAGRFAEAIQATERAVARALAAGNTNLATQLQSRLEHFRAGRAFHAIPVQSPR